jgi:hypothetical protein
MEQAFIDFIILVVGAKEILAMFDAIRDEYTKRYYDDFWKPKFLFTTTPPPPKRLPFLV